MCDGGAYSSLFLPKAQPYSKLSQLPQNFIGTLPFSEEPNATSGTIAAFLHEYNNKLSKETHIHPQHFLQRVTLSDGSKTTLYSLSNKKPYIHLNLDSLNHPSWIAKLRTNRQLLDEHGSVARFSRRYGEKLSTGSWSDTTQTMGILQNEANEFGSSKIIPKEPEVKKAAPGSVKQGAKKSSAPASKKPATPTTSPPKKK